MIEKPSDCQSTPQQLWDELNKIHHFTIDAAANAQNTKCQDWYGPGSPFGKVDALAVEWDPRERHWLNPPYSRGLQEKFVLKAIDCAKRGGYTVALLPADTSTKLFWDHIYDKWPIEFLKGRLRFDRPDQPERTTAAKTGSMLVYFVDHTTRDVMPLNNL